MQRCVITVTLFVLALAAATAAPAKADVLPTGPIRGGGGYVIHSCGESGEAVGWTFETNVSTDKQPSPFETFRECPPVAGKSPLAPDAYARTAIFAGATQMAGYPHNGSPREYALLRFEPPGGTAIIRVRMWRTLGKQADNDWDPYIALGATSGPRTDECEMGTHGYCGTGGNDWYPNDQYGTMSNRTYYDSAVALPGQAFDGMRVGLNCRNGNGQCLNGATLSYAEAQVYSVFFTLSETGAPTIGAPGGSGWTASGWQSQPLTFAMPASDAIAGIRELRVLVDGEIAGTTRFPCDYTKLEPCLKEQADAQVTLDPASVPDGHHEVRLAAVDGAGNVTTSAPRPSPLATDAHPPAAPLDLRMQPVTPTDVALSWRVPEDSGVPITGARVQICNVMGCGPTTYRADTLTTAARIPVPVGAEYARVWLVDELGHEDPARSARVAVPHPPPRTDPPPTNGPASTTTGQATTPTAPVTPARRAAKLRIRSARRTHARITVTGTITRAARGRLTVRVGAKGVRATARRPAIARGRFRTTIALPTRLRTRSRLTVTAAYPGSRELLPATVRVRRARAR